VHSLAYLIGVQRVNGCYCVSARANDSGGSAMRDPPNERRRTAGQTERAHREGQGVQARPVKTFRTSRRCQKETADL